MTRDPDLETVNRALSVTVQKMQRDLAEADARIRHLCGAMECAVKQIEDRLHLAAHQTLAMALWGEE